MEYCVMIDDNHYSKVGVASILDQMHPFSVQILGTTTDDYMIYLNIHTYLMW